MLTIAKLSRWSIAYYNDTASAAGAATRDAERAGGGLGEYYTEHDTRTPVWVCAGDVRTAARLVGLTDVQRAGGDADPAVVARWLDDGIAPGGAGGRRFGKGSVHGFDLTFCAPKSVSLIRALGADDVTDKAITDAHATAIAEAMEYLSAHAGYTRVHNPVTGEKDLLRLPGLIGIGYQHETSRCGDPHLHTHVIVPNRQPRADGRLVSLDGTSLFHEARAAGMIYQATLRRELHRALGAEWSPVDESTGMAEVAAVTPASITAWSRRSSQLRAWAAGHLALVEPGELSAAQLAAAQKATRPAKPEQLGWAALRSEWRGDPRGLDIDASAHRQARTERLAGPQLDARRIAAAAERIDKAAFTRADLVEVLAAQLPVDTTKTPRMLVEQAVNGLAVRLTAPRLPHQREGHERFALAPILAEEAALADLVDARLRQPPREVNLDDLRGLSSDQRGAVYAIAASSWLVQPLSAPAGAGKTTSLRALASITRRRRGHVYVLAPTGKAVDVAVREGAGDTGHTLAKALHMLGDHSLALRPQDLVVLDEAAMVGTTDLHTLLAATTAAGVKTVLVGDAHQLAPVKARGGMFAQLCDDLPWAQTLSEVWRQRDPDERDAALALRDGDPAHVRAALGFYRANDRLHCGDTIAMARDALQAYRADVAAGKNALLLSDITDLTNALNIAAHRDTIHPDAPTVTATHGHRVAVGDLILSRRNDPTCTVLEADRDAPAPDMGALPPCSGHAICG